MFNYRDHCSHDHVVRLTYTYSIRAITTKLLVRYPLIARCTRWNLNVTKCVIELCQVGGFSRDNPGTAFSTTNKTDCYNTTWHVIESGEIHPQHKPFTF